MENPDKEYPSNSNIGLTWFEDEETILLEELNKNIDIETISQYHKRTIGGINARRREIAYKMYLKNISIEEITKKTKLDAETINQTIDNRKNARQRHFSLENELVEMKNDIKEIKNTIKELFEMMKAVYEFEDPSNGDKNV
jgi:DNA repair exonuclease SbcCD ATPase subunit